MKWVTENLDLINTLATLTLAVAAVIISFKSNKMAKQFSKLNQTLSEDQMLHGLFTDFNRKYDAINNSLYHMEDSLKYDPEMDFSTLMRPEWRDHYMALMDYFNLCAEERFWRKKERIPDEVWYSWSKGIKYWFDNIPVVEVVWQSEIEDQGYESFYLEKGEKLFEDPLGKINLK